MWMIVINFWDTHVVAHLCLSADIMHALATDDDTLTLTLLPIIRSFVLDDSGWMKEPLPPFFCNEEGWQFFW